MEELGFNLASLPPVPEQFSFFGFKASPGDWQKLGWFFLTALWCRKTPFVLVKKTGGVVLISVFHQKRYKGP